MSDNNQGINQLFRILRIAGFLVVLFLIFVIIRGGILEHQHQYGLVKRQKKYFKAFNHSFKGTVLKIKRRPPKVKGGIREVCYRIRLVESTTSSYLPFLPKNVFLKTLEKDLISPDTLIDSIRPKEFFCLIDFPYAEVMSRDYGDTRVGDTCFFNGITDCFGIKVANDYWYLVKPEINDYELLRRTYSSIPRYDSIDFEKRKRTYPPRQMATIDQINYYWEQNCDKRKAESLSINYNLPIYNYDNRIIKKNTRESIKKQHIQPFFYLIQVDEYKTPLDLDTLQKKFKKEPIIWVEHEGVNKYFINRKIDSHKDAEDYLNLIVERYGLGTEDMPVIAKINRTERDINREFKRRGLDVLTDKKEPDIVLIPYRTSIFKHAWIIFILFTFVNVFTKWYSISGQLSRNKELRKSFQQYAIGLLFFFNIWLLTLGIGLEFDMVDSIFEYMLNKGKPVVVIANIYLMIFLFIATRWIFMKNGAEMLARINTNPGGLFSPGHTPDGIKLLWTVTVMLGLVFIFARLFF